MAAYDPIAFEGAAVAALKASVVALRQARSPATLALVQNALRLSRERVAMQEPPPCPTSTGD